MKIFRMMRAGIALAFVFSIAMTLNVFSASIGETFSGSISVGGAQLSCTYKVTSADTVQIGDGLNPAIDTSVSGDVVIPETVTYGNVTYRVKSVGDVAFSGCAITSTGLGGNLSVTHVGSSAYSSCANLKDTGLGQNVNVMTLGNAVFYDCTALEKTGFDANKTIYTIPNSAFAGCTALKETGLSTNSVVRDILDSAFLACKSLGSTGIGSHSNILTIGNQAFSETAISSTGLRDNASVTQIGERAFEMCENLVDTGLSTNKTVSIIGKFAFWYCTSLVDTGLREESNISELGAGAFYGCEGLNEYVELPKSLTSAVFYDSFAPNASEYDVFAETPVKHILFTNSSLAEVEVRDEEWRNTYWGQDVTFERAFAYFPSGIENENVYESSGGYTKLYKVNIEGGAAAIDSAEDAQLRLGTGFENSFVAGDKVKITADVVTGKSFKTWETSDVELLQATVNVTSFTMPSKDVNIKAVFVDSSGENTASPDTGDNSGIMSFIIISSVSVALITLMLISKTRGGAKR